MKKGTAVSGFASLLLAGAMCAGFAACKDTAEDFVSEKVDASAFGAAFETENFSNVLYEGKITKETGAGENYGKSVSELKLVIDGIDEYMKGTETYEGLTATENGRTETELEAYYSEEQRMHAGGPAIYPVVYIKNESGVWEKGIRFSEPFRDFYTYQPSRLLNDISFGEDDYASFSFNAEKKGYYRETNGETALLKFKGGKVFSIEIILSDSDRTIGMNFRFTYGGQEVALPTVG